MPCFDKKLEATRENHKDNNNNLEVDTVISTIEILDLLTKLNIDFPNYVPKENQNIFYSFSQLVSLFYENKNQELKDIVNNDVNNSNNDKNIQGFRNEKYDKQEISNEDLYSSIFYTESNFSSNGYAEYIIEKIIKIELEKNPNIKYEINRKTLKNSDFKEIELKLYSDKSINNKESPLIKCFNFAIIYGFRNIQNLIRNKNKIKYQYLEVMACPGGCLNGGK